MGSHTRVNINYTALAPLIKSADNAMGTFMEGTSVYASNFPNSGILVFGNEANGISENISSLLTEKLSIPRFGAFKKTESLNVANAVSIFLSEYRRRSTET
jgi:TrmH family RNA methyltransferase